MCGIFGIISQNTANEEDYKILAKLAQQRGKDSSGIIKIDKNHYSVIRSDSSILDLIGKLDLSNSSLLLGHSRLITNGHSDNQPVSKGEVILLHNGIIVNDSEIWNSIDAKREQRIDSEVIAGIASDFLEINEDIQSLPKKILKDCKGVVSCALLIPKLGKLLLFSNNGSLYLGKKGGDTYFSSEKFPLTSLNCVSIEQILNNFKIIDIPSISNSFEEKEYKSKRLNLVPELVLSGEKEKLLEYPKHDLKRCKKCILPETMPFISFNSEGVCNYCTNYELRNVPKDKSILFDLIEKYRRPKGNECLIPFSGGRDSCYGLHLVVKELGLKPLAYTYDWGMVTDLGRRNISRMCSQLGIENIIIAADITKKRKHISRNISAWLKSPHLGMISIFTAGDKHFFRHVETVKKQNGISLNLWGINPLEVTHFKAGFLGVPPDFEEKKVYSSGGFKQLRYQWLRFKAMTESIGYFNSSIWDTLLGEYYRSYHKKTDYFHIFDYWRWDENLINEVLLNEYEWEKAQDTNTTWRIGDGTAAFYNYIYYTLAGFTEHDTFRSNQIREGQLSRDEAIKLVEDENRPRYQNLQWYLDTVGLDFEKVISRINSLPRNYVK
tara:strand:- start:683 stop:2506 length:1824 start_codon:yes stop_codon:yes gene_type:complete